MKTLDRIFLVLILAFTLNSCAKSTKTRSDVPDTGMEGIPETSEDYGQDSQEIWLDTSRAEPWKHIKIKAFPGLDPTICASDEAPNHYGFDIAYKMIRSGSFVQDKNFYLFNIIKNILKYDKVFADVVKNDAVLGKLDKVTVENLQKAAQDCTDAGCLKKYALLSQDTINAVDNEMKTVFTGKINIATRHLRPSGVFALFAHEDDAKMVSDCVIDQLNGLNHVIGDYMDNVPFEKAVEIVKKEAADDSGLFFSPLLNIAMALMKADKRDEAGRYEPMADGVNKAAVARIKDIDWNAYPFTAILIPGEGPTDMNTPLSNIGAQRCDTAYLRWKAGAAPFIVTSGGHVHPDRTPYSEAIEMKKYLVSKYNVPEYAIIVDPHARHTTTNLRDVTRLLIRYGFPVDRPFMTTTDFIQSAYILLLGDRCMKELGYKPWRALKKMTKTDNCLLPSFLSLYYSSDDPLDP